MQTAEILIVGGGPAGLCAAGALKQAGLEATILDSGERIGSSWERRYERLHLHTVRAYSGLAHYPIPSRYPKYLAKDQYAAYLREYAGHFALRCVQNTRVERICRDDGGWRVETSGEPWSARVVVVATGQYGEPIQPDWPGQEEYRGERLHSAGYRSGSGYQGRRVLVVGAGNSGMEIAADLAEQDAVQVAISIRSGPPVVPRDFLGVPAQVFGILMNSFPPALSDQMGKLVSRLALGNLSRFGLPSPGWAPFASHRTPVIDVGFVRALKAGKISVRPAARSFTSSGVIYQDDRQEEWDAVIFATGFHTGLDQFLEPAGLIDPNGNPRFPSGASTPCPGLYFMGYYDSLRGFLYESNLASQRLAREIRAKRTI